ncbi:MAG: TonB-dependent receptor domain-containing protein [Oceanococcus sp.]
MKINRSANGISSLSGIIALAALSLSWSASAQNAEQVDLEAVGAEAQDAAEDATDDAVELGAVQVTGSRIKQANLTSSSPVTIVNDTEIKYQGTVRVEDLINSMPQAFADQGGNLSNGATGTATVNLRNLGSERTLVLINGKRMHSGDPREPVADLNTIPAALIERVEIVTGGASAVYGSDAVAGVVNFIMKKNFTGVQLDYQHSFYMHENDNSGAQQRLNDKGFDVPAGSVTDGQSNTLSLVMGSDSADGLGNSTIYATYRKLNQVRQSERDYSACAVAGDPQECIGSGTTFPTHFLAFNADFTDSRDLIIDQSTGDTLRDFDGSTDTFNFAPFNYYQRNNENYTLGGMFSREINESMMAYTDIAFTEDRTNGVIAPSGVFGTVSQLQCDNPLLSDDQRQQICTDLGYGPTDTANVFLLRRNIEGGARDDDLTHQSLRSVFGVEGDFELMGLWSYDVFAQLSRAKLNQIYRNDMSVTRQNRAIDAVDDGNGNIVCRSVMDGTDPNCVVYNIFDTNVEVDPAALAYIQVPGLLSGNTEQKIIGATVSGNFDELIVPGASSPLGFAFGMERRSEEASFETDLAFRTGDLAGQGGATLGTGGEFDLFEVFFEARIPLIQDRYLVKDLNLDLGYRFSDYSSTSSTDTYKVQMGWSLNDEINLRGGYNRAVRAPNIVELSQPMSVNLAGNTDPCSGDTPDATAEQCANDPVIAQRPDLYGNITPNPANQYNGLYGTSPGLKPEEADTYTLGLVYTPEFLRNFSLTLDYYDIKVTGLIDSYGADTVLRECYDNNNLCDLVSRDPQTGSLWLGTTGFVNVQTLNTGSRQVSGIDLNMNYRWDAEDLGMLNFEFVGAYNMADEVIRVPGSAAFDCEGRYGLECEVPKPDWRHKFRTRWLTPYNGIEASFNWRYIGGVSADDASGAAAAEQEIGSYSYFDLGATVPYGNLSFRVGLNNILDRDPPVIGDALPGIVGNGNTFPQVYDALGRYVFLGVTADF